MSTDPRLLERNDAKQIMQRIMHFVQAPEASTRISVQSWWNGELRWARNRVSIASDRRDIQISVSRFVEGAVGKAVTNQVDDVSLEAVVRVAERSALMRLNRTLSGMPVPAPEFSTPATRIWSDVTYNVTAEERGRLASRLADSAETKDLLSSGYIEMRAGALAVSGAEKDILEKMTYATYSQSQCSMTVRHPKGVGSGWAGLSSYDWSAIDSDALAKLALDKCVASLNPVAIEPGRYTVVLEPQAVCDIVEPLFTALKDRGSAERGGGPFFLALDPTLQLARTKLGLKVIDERITISHDPMDPLLGVLPSPGLRPTTWIDRGVLTTLSYDRTYAVPNLNDNLGDDGRDSFRMSGGTTTVAEMIQSTKRGLLVTRFSGLMGLNPNSLLMTGVTRDGLWLIENGAISKAVKNLRLTESPMFVLNQVEQLGVPVPVFRPVGNPYQTGVSPAIVPAIKANDFSFSATIDAI